MSPPPLPAETADAARTLAEAGPTGSPKVATREQYCADKPCRTYDESVATVRRLAKPGGGPGCLRGEAGRCGALRYVYFNDGFGSFEEWFDGSGAMVGAHTQADYDRDGATFGTAPSCAKVKTETLCSRQ